MGLAPRIENIENGTTGPLSFRNKIINGRFDIWQRGTSQTSSGYGSDDRWSSINNGSGKTHSQQIFALGQTDVPGNPRYFSRTVVTSTAGAGNYVAKVQNIESVRTLAGQVATLSFWAKADANKNIAIEFMQSFGTGGSPSALITGINVTTCALTSSWKKFVITLTVPSISGKTLGTGDDDYLAVVFWLDAGSNLNARTNSLGQQSGTFDIANVQLEAGSTATAFEHRPIGTELALCQRYYEQMRIDFRGSGTSGFYVEVSGSWAVPKRATPSSSSIFSSFTTSGVTSFGLGVVTIQNCSIRGIASATGAVEMYGGLVAASAEL